MIRRLDRLKMQFDRDSTKERLQLIRSLARTRLIRADQLLTYHDLLCVARAYPENSRVHRVAERELRSYHRRMKAYLSGGRRSSRADHLLNSGLSHTDVVHPFTLEITERLVHRYPGRLEIEWDELEEAADDALFALLTLVVEWTENDSLDYDPELSLREWLERARGRKRQTLLEVLLRLLTASGLPRPAQRQLFDRLELPIRWRLGSTPSARDRHRLRGSKIWYQAEPRRRRCAHLRDELARPADPLQRVSAERGRYYVRALQEAQAVRNRELFPVVFAHPAETYLVEPGRGVQFVIFGMKPEMRLPFESNFGALIIRNGMPVGYGIAAPWFDRCEIAINIFPAYRSGESAYIFEQFFRVFHHHFGAQALFVRSHQMGEDDDEPLLSGAFWFYYKLGFRAVQPRVRRLAEREAARMQREPGYRSSLATLRRMSGTDVYLHVDLDRTAPYTELSLVNLAYAVTDYFSRRAQGDRDAGVHLAVQRVTRSLRIRGLSRWNSDELEALRRWAPLVDSIPGLGRWSPQEREAAVQILKAKGGRLERRFVLLCNQHDRLRDALYRIASRGPATGAV